MENDRIPGSDMKKYIFLSLASFSNRVTPVIFSSFVPVLLERRLGNTSSLGALLTLLGSLAILLHPISGNLSDRTRCRFGRRRPYIFFGSLLCAVSFALIPRAQSFAALCALLCVYTLCIEFWRSPLSGLMIDIVPTARLPRINAMTSSFIGLACVIAYLLSSSISAQSDSFNGIFLAGALLTAGTAILACMGVKEQDSRHTEMDRKGKKSVVAFLKTLPKQESRFIFIVVGSLAFSFIAVIGMEFYLVLISEKELGSTASVATGLLALDMFGYFAVSLFYAYWTQHHKIRGDKQTLGASLLLALSFLGLYAFYRSGGGAAWIPYALMVAFGLEWGCFNIFSSLIFLQSAKPEYAGTYMGCYFISIGAARALAPLVFGVFRDITGSYLSLFLFGFVLMLLCTVMVLWYKKYLPKTT